MLLAFAGLAWDLGWRGFDTLTVTDEALVLSYQAPRREVRLTRAELLEVSDGPAGKASREVRLRTRSGAVHVSGQLSVRAADELVKRLQRWRAE